MPRCCHISLFFGRAETKTPTIATTTLCPVNVTHLQCGRKKLKNENESSARPELKRDMTTVYAYRIFLYGKMYKTFLFFLYESEKFIRRFLPLFRCTERGRRRLGRFEISTIREKQEQTPFDVLKTFTITNFVRNERNFFRVSKNTSVL